MAAHADIPNLFHLLLNGFGQPLQLNQQHRGRVHRITRVRRLFHHAQHHAVQHLYRNRRDRARGNFGHGLAAIVGGFVNGKNRLHQLRLAHQPDNHFCHQRHRAFRTGQQPRQIVSGQVLFLAAGLNHGAVRQHRFQAQNVIGGNSVSKRMRTAGVLGDVAANGAGALTRRIGGVEILLALHSERDVQVHDARFHHGAFVVQIDLLDLLHPHK